MMRSLFNINIQELKGVGEKRAQLFTKLGAPSVGALLRLYPRAYEDWSCPHLIKNAPLNEPCAIRATVLSKPKEIRIRSSMTLYKVNVTDGVNDMEITFFNNPYILKLLKENEEYTFYGKVTANFLKRQMSSPKFIPSKNSPKVFPIYPLTEGLTNRIIVNTVKNALKLLPDAIRDPIPENLRMEYGLCHLRFALLNIHFPNSMEDMLMAKRRLAFEELLVLQLGLLQLKLKNRSESQYKLSNTDVDKFYSLLPYKPTSAQNRAVTEALKDMTSGKTMSRLIQGDVGSGKTAVAAALCYCTVQNGIQAALMAPTEILAQQHYKSFSHLLKNINVALLTGSMSAPKKREVLSGLSSGEIQLVIGTHALISKGVSFKNLGLVITDEQHRFGVSQRAELAIKGNNPHMLVMSATPIPRTLALMIYGDLDISILDELPPGRQKVDTYAITSNKRKRAFNFIKKQIDEGRQCYIICPMIDESGNDMASVKDYSDKVKNSLLPGYNTAILHGKMKSKEKEEVMRDFLDNKISVLISTTVVEVGVDVPNATVMLIENAERYGLSQLHQLRGRVGRGKYKSTCILISDAQNSEAVTRLKAMCLTNDGFKISEQDLKLRGPGDFFGQRQHGLPELKIADMINDIDIIKQSQSAAQKIISADTALTKQEHRGLRAEVKQLFKGTDLI
jgi:ATP-dependent DNA helicase RecG